MKDQSEAADILRRISAKLRTGLATQEDVETLRATLAAFKRENVNAAAIALVESSIADVQRHLASRA